MPQLIYLWNFEDGTAQGWEFLDPDVALAGDSGFQGTYNVRISKSLPSANTDYIYNVMRIRNINLAQAQRPLLLIPVRANPPTGTGWTSTYDIRVTLLDSSLSPIVTFTSFQFVNYGYSEAIKVHAIDLTQYKTLVFGIQIAVRMRHTGGGGTGTIRFDMIAIVEPDSALNTGIVQFTNEGRIVSRAIDIPVTAGSRLVLESLANPPWFHGEATTTDRTAVTFSLLRGDGQTTTITLDSSSTEHRHATLPTDVTQLVSRITGFTIDTKIASISAYYSKYRYMVVLTIFTAGYSSYAHVLTLTVSVTINPHTPPTQTGVVVIQPGQTYTQQFEFNANVRLAAGGVRLRVSITTGNFYDILTGVVTISVYRADTNTLVGSASVDPKTANVVTSDLISLESDVLYRIVITFNGISVRANVSLAGYIIYEVA